MQSLQNSHAVNINITKIFCAVVQASSSTSLFSRAIFPTPCRSMRTPHSRIAGRMRCHRCGWYISPPLSKRPLSNCLAWRIWCPEGHFWHIFLVLTNYTLIRRFFSNPWQTHPWPTMLLDFRNNVAPCTNAQKCCLSSRR